MTTEMMKIEGDAVRSEMSLKQIGDRVNLVHTVLEKVMLKGTHYGTVPGCGNKMVLLKPGADVLAMTFRLVPQFKVERIDMGNGHREYDVTCSMFGPDGTMLGQGVGSASTMEKKYRYRKDGDGKKIENEDIADCYNTVLKIAKKRAHIDGTLTVTGCADLFTQDLIEDDEEDRKPVAMPTEKVEQKKDAPPPPPPPAKVNKAAGNVTKGVVKTVTKKPGKNAKGEYLRYGVLIDGEWHNTFDTKLGEAATELKGSEVIARWTPDGQFRKLETIDPAEAVEPDEVEPPETKGNDEQLPF